MSTSELLELRIIDAIYECDNENEALTSLTNVFILTARNHGFSKEEALHCMGLQWDALEKIMAKHYAKGKQ